MPVSARRYAGLALLGLAVLLPVAALAAPVPGFTPAPAGAGAVLTNEPYTAQACFDNLSPTDTGYQPKYQVVVPPGSTLNSAQYLSFNLPVQAIGTCNLAGGCPTGFVNPATGATVPLQFGETLVLVGGSSGSFAPAQPPACVSLSFGLGDATVAPLGVTRNIAITPFFAFGADALDNPQSDPPIVGSPATLGVTPSVIRLTKAIAAPESETATGPNYPRSFTLTLDIANAQTLSAIDLGDVLPDTLQYVAGSAVVTGCPGPVESVATPGATPGGTLARRCATDTGTTAGDDLVLTFQAYVPQNDGVGAPVVTPTAPSRPIANTGTVAGQYDSPDATPPGPIGATSNPATLTAKLLTLRKGVAVAIDTGASGPSPGDTLEYTLVFDLSDYHSVSLALADPDRLRFVDVLGDGQTFVGCGNATTTIAAQANGVPLAATPTGAAACSATTKAADGTTTITLDAAALLQATYGDTLHGDLANDAVQSGPTVVTVRFRATIDVAYSRTPWPGPGQPELTLGDTVGNAASGGGASAGTAVSDATGASATIVNAAFAKSIYAYTDHATGTTSIPPPAGFLVSPGDSLTYRLTWALPLASYEVAKIDDYLPSPVFDAAQITAADPASARTGAAPPAGTWTAGPLDTFTKVDAGDGIGLVQPALATSGLGGENRVTWNYGTYLGQQTNRVVDLLFTVEATTRPFGDALNLLNLAQLQYQNTVAVVTASAAGVLFTTRAPDVTIRKAIVAASNPACVGAAPPASYDSARSGCDAGDQIDFRLTLANGGRSPAYNVRVDDDGGLPVAGFAGSCTLQGVTLGDGTTPVATGGSLFDTAAAGGLTIAQIPADSDPAVLPGEQVFVNYRCTVATSGLPGPPSAFVDNTARLKYYASDAAQATDPLYNYASNQSSPGPNVRKARVGLANPLAITKAITGSSVAGTAGSNVNAGETLDFTVVVTLAEGRHDSFQLADSLAALPADWNCSTPGIACANVAVVGATAQKTATVPATTGTSVGTIAWTYTSAQLYASGSNTASATEAALAAPVTATRSWTLVSPVPSVGKAFSPTSADAGDTVQIRLGWTNANAGSPMFRCVITDNVNTTFFDPGTLAPVATPAGYSFAADTVTGAVTYTATGTTAPCPTVAPGGAIFSVQVRNSVTTGGAVPNTASLAGNTLPTPQSGGVGVSGSATANLTLTTPAANAKTISATTESDTAGANVAIGEVVTYRVTFTLPEGVTQNVRIVDEMQGELANFGFVPGSVRLARSSTALSAANDPGGINSAPVGTYVAVSEQCAGTAPCAANEVRVDLGNVTNAPDATVSDSYTLEIQFRALNVAANQGGSTRANRGRLIYRPTGAGADQTLDGGAVTATVVAPIVQVQKAASPVSIAGGGTVTYTLTIRNNASGPGAGPAYEFAFGDTLPAELLSPTLLPLPPGVTAAFADNVLSGSVARLDPSTQLQVQYTATVDPATPLGRTIVNAASAQATSLPGPCGTGGNPATPCAAPQGDPGTSSGERTGAGGAVNNLAAAITAPFTTAGVNVTKTLLNPQAYYAIGDRASYEIRAALPVGTARAFRLRDTLPAGLSFDAGSATVSTTGGPVTYTGAPTPPGQAAQTLTFAFGDVTTATAAGEIVVRYTATVANVIANQNNGNRVNSAAALYEDPNNAANTLSSAAPSNPTVRVGEPNLAIVKAITAGAAGADAGNSVDWSFTVSNGGTTTAHRTEIRDVLPPGLDGITNVGLATTGGVTLNGTATPLALANVRVRTTVNPNDTIEVAESAQGDAADTVALAPGASLTITFRSTVMNTVTPGQVLTNAIRVPYASQPDCGAAGVVCRDNSSSPGNVDDDDDAQLDNYEESGSASLTIRSNIAIDKEVAPAAAPVGATVVFSNRIDLIEGVTPNVVVTDVLPAGMSYVSHSIAVGNLGMVFGNPGYDTRLGSGQTVTFDLGSIVNPGNGNAGDDFFTVQISARIDNVAANQSGVVLKNGEQASGSLLTVTYGTVPATVTFDADPLLPGNQGRPLTVQEPALAIDKTAVPLSQALGDVVTYALTVTHTGASTSNAFDLVLTDTLPAGMAFVPGSVNPPGAFGGIAGQVLTLDAGTLTLAAGSTTISYQARILPSAAVGVPLVNSVAGVYASQPDGTGAPDSGRTGSGGINDYGLAASAQATPNANAFIEAQKTVAIAVDADASGNLTPGDTLEYTVVLANTNGVATNVVFTDPVPADTTLVPGATTTTRGTIAESATLLTVAVGTMGGGETVTVRFRITVDAGTPQGTVIANQGSVDSDQTVPEPTDVDGVDANGDQPTEIVVGGAPTPGSALYAEKYVALQVDADGSGSVTQGDRMRYTVVVSNLGGSAVADVAFADTIPAGLAYVGGSAVASAGVVGVTGQALDWSGIGTLAPAAFATLTFDVTVAAVVPPSQSFVNQGNATSAQTGPVPTDGNGDPVDGNQPTRFDAVGVGGTPQPVLDVQKRWTLAVDTVPVGLASPGDTIEYTIFVGNTGSTAATDVRLTDPGQSCTGALTPCTAFVAGSLTTSQGAIVSTVPIEVNLGNLAPGANAVVTFRVRVDNATASGVVVANQAAITAAGIAPVLSDDNGNAVDGRNPTLTPISTGGGLPPGQPRDLTKAVVGTSEPDANSAGARALIGEVLRYRFGAAMPKGTLRQVTLFDALPAGLAYVPGSARLARGFDTALVASANPGSVNAAASGSFVPLVEGSGIAIGNGAGGTTTLSVFLGDVVNSDADTGAAETYVLEYRAAVTNVAGNRAGTALANTATVRYWDGLGQPQSSPPVLLSTTVSEPALTLTKSAQPGRLPARGDRLQFTLTVANGSGANAAPAFDIVLGDALPPQFASVGPRTILAVGADGVVDATVGTGIGVSIARLAPGGSVTVTFEADAPGPLVPGSIVNAATTSWTSLPGNTGSSGDGTQTPGAPGTATGERTGSGGVNDYTAAASATVIVSVEAIPTLSDLALLLLCSLLLLSGAQRLRLRR